MCTNYNLIQTTTEQLIQDGGEGVILRKAESFYQHGRSPFLMKIKVCKIKER
jgi:ATP-dependent DNA ligase